MISIFLLTVRHIFDILLFLKIKTNSSCFFLKYFAFLIIFRSSQFLRSKSRVGELLFVKFPEISERKLWIISETHKMGFKHRKQHINGRLNMKCVSWMSSLSCVVYNSLAFALTFSLTNDEKKLSSWFEWNIFSRFKLICVAICKEMYWR